ncbi:hypothetical protein ACS0TY_015656 [Phlomoides rotata]
MVNVRNQKQLEDPPPEYPQDHRKGALTCVYITITLKWGGEFRKVPFSNYHGGNTIKLDWVIGSHLGWNALVNSVNEYLGEPVGKIRKFYYLWNNAFHLLTTDEEVRKWTLMHMPVREFVIYVDDIPDGKGKGICLDNEGEVYEKQGVGLDNEGEVNDGKGKGKSEEKGRKKGRGKGKSDGKGKGKSEEKGEEKSYEKGKGKSEEEGGQGENDSGLEDFSEEDYNMEEDNEDESDDALFDKYVCKDKSVVNDSESRESSSDEDVVVADGDFDEYKDSDSEHNGIRYPVFNPVVMFDKPEFELGMIFSNRVDFKKAVQSHAIAAKRSVEFTKVAPERVYARCKDKECGWKLTILKLSGEETYQVRDYQPNHICAPEFKVANVKSKWLSEKFIRKFVADPKRNTHAFRKDVMHELGCDVSKHQAIRAKRLALKKLEGCPDS